MDCAWDDNGNLLSDGVRTYQYDHANGLKQVTEGSLTTQFAYNGDGVRTTKTIGAATTDYVVDLAAVLPVVISDTDAVYLYGLDIIAEQLAGADRYYYVHDGLGSVRQLLDSTGQLSTRYAYDPFGVPLAGNGVPNPWQFTGEAWDAEVELLYLRARYYQPETGRFITKDPWPGDLWRPGTLNPYVYVGNNALNRTDPTGEQWTDPTPTPTEREREIMEWADQIVEQAMLGHCYIATIPRQGPTPAIAEMSAVNPGIGLVFQRSVPPRERVVTFWTLYVEWTERGPIPAIASGYVTSGLELTVKVYLNGAFVDAFDTYDTTNLTSLAKGMDFPPSVYRSVELYTDRGVARGPFRFTTIERQRTGWRLGPFSIGGGVVDPRPFELAQLREKGRGHADARTWFPAGEGLPAAARMNLTIPELLWQTAGAVGDGPTFGPTGYYQVTFGDIYPGH